ncbi:MAG: hypothetical protein RLZZ308_285 [Candidatus Parcubacteria bacterium]|jgi:hypothetical protein
MDYQASASSGKRVGVSLKKIIQRFFLFFVLFSFPYYFLFAQVTTTNPLTVDISISAVVPQPPIVYPDTPPIPPTSPIAPITIDTTDVAVFKGLAYPGSVISLLKNGSIVAEMPASPNGTFEIRLRNLTQGTYSFGVRAEDTERRTSKLLTFTIYVTSGVTTIVDGIFIPPTITSDKVEVKRGEIITFLGRSSPDAEVRLSFHSDTELLKKTKANSQGSWLYKLDSSELELGDHDGKARSLTVDDLSPYSQTVPFRVGDTDRIRTQTKELAGFRKRCDLNNDNRVNILDFSIMAFWYKRLGFPVKVDLSSDGKINLTDLSILAYCWTG